MRKINPELWLLLFLLVIAAMLNFLVASQKMALVFYFLPTLFSAYLFWTTARDAHRGGQRGAGRPVDVRKSVDV